VYDAGFIMAILRMIDLSFSTEIGKCCKHKSTEHKKYAA